MHLGSTGPVEHIDHIKQPKRNDLPTLWQSSERCDVPSLPTAYSLAVGVYDSQDGSCLNFSTTLSCLSAGQYPNNSTVLSTQDEKMQIPRGTNLFLSYFQLIKNTVDVLEQAVYLQGINNEITGHFLPVSLVLGDAENNSIPIASILSNKIFGSFFGEDTFFAGICQMLNSEELGIEEKPVSEEAAAQLLHRRYPDFMKYIMKIGELAPKCQFMRGHFGGGKKRPSFRVDGDKSNLLSTDENVRLLSTCKKWKKYRNYIKRIGIDELSNPSGCVSDAVSKYTDLHYELIEFAEKIAERDFVPTDDQRHVFGRQPPWGDYYLNEEAQELYPLGGAWLDLHSDFKDAYFNKYKELRASNGYFVYRVSPHDKPGRPFTAGTSSMMADLVAGTSHIGGPADAVNRILRHAFWRSKFIKDTPEDYKSHGGFRDLDNGFLANLSDRCKELSRKYANYTKISESHEDN